MLLSFIIPAHNEEQLLGRTLASLSDAAATVGLRYELIVVDDASTDGTAAIAADAGARVVSVNYRQISRVRNAGARAAQGDLFIFVDADTIVGAATLRATMAAVNNGVVGGGALVDFDGELPLGVRMTFPVLHLIMRVVHMAAGAYVFCTRAAFEATGGFDETIFVSEEIWFSRALRRVGRIVILNERVVSSGRKVRTHTTWEMLVASLRATRHALGSRRRRDGLEFWYGHRREDPKESQRDRLPK